VVPVRPIEDPDEGFREVMRGLAASARQANLARTAVLEEALRALRVGPLAPDARDAAVRAAHQVVGSAGTFGRHRSSELAAGLEQWFRTGPLQPKDAGLEQAWQQVAALRADLDADPDEGYRNEV
jgi:HPt (histidine-containing phosphotransfer) domain-containing protein